MKEIIKPAVLALGIVVRRARPVSHSSPGWAGRPIASIESFLEDLKARDFNSNGLIDVGANEGDWPRLARSSFPQIP